MVIKIFRVQVSGEEDWSRQISVGAEGQGRSTWAGAEVMFRDSIAAGLPGSSMGWCAQSPHDMLFVCCMVSLLLRRTHN